MSTNLIKNLHTSLPRGAPFDTSILKRLGVSAALAHEYVKAGWLEKLGRGVFMFAGDDLKREDTLSFLEPRISDLHIAAKTALSQSSGEIAGPHCPFGSHNASPPDTVHLTCSKTAFPMGSVSRRFPNHRRGLRCLVRNVPFWRC
jgi:hypothetical protein